MRWTRREVAPPAAGRRGMGDVGRGRAGRGAEGDPYRPEMTVVVELGGAAVCYTSLSPTPVTHCRFSFSLATC